MVVVECLVAIGVFFLSIILFPVVASLTSRRIADEFDQHIGTLSIFFFVENPALALTPVASWLILIFSPSFLFVCDAGDACGIGRRLFESCLVGLLHATFFAAITVGYIFWRSHRRQPVLKQSMADEKNAPNRS